ncbi:MAG TPA: FkbM family methyltransferase [Bacteroidota bacterium]|nr:FkbM family methyltransferase [Bacteroidota bacterium]
MIPRISGVLRRIGLLGEKPVRGIIPKKVIARFVPSDPIVIEAGAHVGVDTVEMAKRWPRGTIYAFEPVPELFEQLRLNTNRYRNVRCFQSAVGDKTGMTEIHISTGASDGSSSLLNPKEHLRIHPDVLFPRSVTVPITTLDDWAMKNAVSRVDLLWLDLQGYELRTMMSSPKVLSTVSAIHSEVMLIESYEGNSLYKDLRPWLESAGFYVEKEEIPWDDSGNVLFIRRKQTASRSFVKGARG